MILVLGFANLLADGFDGDQQFPGPPVGNAYARLACGAASLAYLIGAVAERIVGDGCLNNCKGYKSPEST